MSNIMLDPLDKELERRGHRFARYADDFTILVRSQRAGERVLHSISRFLQNRLKLVRTRIGKLLKMGVAIETAVACGRTSKGPCRRSKTPGIQQALSNAYLKAEGLYSLREGWISLHHSV